MPSYHLQTHLIASWFMQAIHWATETCFVIAQSVYGSIASMPNWTNNRDGYYKGWFKTLHGSLNPWVDKRDKKNLRHFGIFGNNVHHGLGRRCVHGGHGVDGSTVEFDWLNSRCLSLAKVYLNGTINTGSLAHHIFSRVIKDFKSHSIWSKCDSISWKIS